MVFRSLCKQGNALGEDIMKMLIIAAAALVGSAGFPATSHAQESIVVRSHDLDLGTERGVRELSQRISRASKLVCEDPATRSINNSMAFQACLKRTAGPAEKALTTVIAQARRQMPEKTASAEIPPLKSR